MRIVKLVFLQEMPRESLPYAGASDCAACVGVALELARLLVADRSRTPQVPVAFLINGGEEAFLLGAHAFREQSCFKEDLAVVVNLYVAFCLPTLAEHC